jgi:UDP-N-acetylmuramoyl-tripeptide--D-alanyl-D-alanine ligase
MSETLWTWRELCEALALPVVDGPDISGISIDSRTAKPGDLFIALTGDPGARFNPSQRSDRDGHDFVDSALERGAAGVLVHDQKSRSCPQLMVADTLDALWDLGRAGRKRLNCAVVAVTGSSGKTTCKSLLTAALDAFATPGSLNNHLGVPLSLARTPKHATTAVFEIGTNHPGEIAPLSKLVQPNVAVVLNVHPAHAENFCDMAELRTEKLSISEGLKEDGLLVVHDEIDDGELPADLARLRFGSTDAADVTLLDVTGDRANFRINSSGRSGDVTAHVPGGGRHRASSLAAVFAVMLALDRDIGDACNLSDDLIPGGRGTHLEAGGITVIDDSYNATLCAARRDAGTRRSIS